MTFSLVARCTRTGRFGMVISSSSPAVAARCAHARAGVGVVASQNVTNPALGPAVLDRLASGLGADRALAGAMAQELFGDHRQVIALGATGPAAIHSGAKALGVWAEAKGKDCASGGNLLSHGGVPAAMVAAFEARPDAPLGERLIAALVAGRDAGGEAGPVHSAGLLIVDRQPWPWAELRIDWAPENDPIAALALAWEAYAPQAEAYVTRALNPEAAPSYGVPGDE